MKLILKSDVEHLGQAGDIVDVADGYGMNFLVPRGLAMKATRGSVADAEAISRARRKREAATLADAEARRDALQQRPVTVVANAGEDGTLYGSIGTNAIARAIRSQLGVELDRRRLSLDRPLKTLGEHEVGARVHRDVRATVKVIVTAA